MSGPWVVSNFATPTYIILCTLMECELNEPFIYLETGPLVDSYPTLLEISVNLVMSDNCISRGLDYRSTSTAKVLTINTVPTKSKLIH